jgi:hypothetical protein
MLGTLAGAFMTATRMDAFAYPAPPAPPLVDRHASLTVRLAAFLRRLMG